MLGDGEAVVISLQIFSLADRCTYGSLKNELICDCMVVGICDKKVSEKMQMNDKLTLKSAKKLVKQTEEIRNIKTLWV